MNQKHIYLITRGDDCGSNHSANRGIQEAYQKGILKNTSLMVVCSAIEEAAELLAGEKNLCFGLHATLNAEWDRVKWGPVLPPEQVPSLLDEGRNFFQTTQALHNNHPRLDEIMAELQAQLEKARRLGFDVRYVDCHMGFTWVLEGLEEEFDAWCQREGLINGNRFKGLPRANGEGDPVEQLIARLESAPAGQYLIVGHPAYDNEEMRALGHPGYPGETVAWEREWQRLIFMDPRILEYCKNNSIVPIRYDEAE